MGKQVGLLTGLLVVALGSGVVAQSPTPLFAPEDLAFTIPSRVGDYELDIDADVEMDPASRDMWSDILLPLRKEPADVQRVTAKAYPIGEASDESAESAFSVSALRVDGVPAGDYAERAMDSALEAAGRGSAMMQSEWRVIDGREVYSLTLAPPEALVQVAIEDAEAQGFELTEQELADLRAYEIPNPDFGLHLYPKGEVLYGINLYIMEAPEGLPTLAEILAELP